MLIAWLKIKTKHLLSTGVLTTLAQNLKLLKPEREIKGAEKKNQRTGDWTLQVMSQIYMEFRKSIQSMKKHYFYSHQKPTKLVYEICLIPIVLWGKLETSSWFLLYIGSAQLIRTYVFLKIGFWWKNPLPSTLRCLRKLLYQYSRAIWSILEVLNAIF